MSEVYQPPRQGDVNLFIVDRLPADAVPVAAGPRGVVLAESERTGHHHRIGPMFRSATRFDTPDGRQWLRVNGAPSRRAAELAAAVNQQVNTAEPTVPDDTVTAMRAEAVSLGAVELVHEEHGPHLIPPGMTFEVVIQREYQPDGVRQVAD